MGQRVPGLLTLVAFLDFSCSHSGNKQKILEPGVWKAYSARQCVNIIPPNLSICDDPMDFSSWSPHPSVTPRFCEI